MTKQNSHVPESRFARATKIFKKHGGLLRTSQALQAGIHPGTLYAMNIDLLGKIENNLEIIAAVVKEACDA